MTGISRYAMSRQADYNLQLFDPYFTRLALNSAQMCTLDRNISDITTSNRYYGTLFHSLIFAFEQRRLSELRLVWPSGPSTSWLFFSLTIIFCNSSHFEHQELCTLKPWACGHTRMSCDLYLRQERFELLFMVVRICGLLSSGLQPQIDSVL